MPSLIRRFSYTLLTIVFVLGSGAQAQLPSPSTFADEVNPLKAQGAPKPDSTWHLDKANGSVSIRIEIPTTPEGGRGPRVPYLLQYNSSSTLTIGLPVDWSAFMGNYVASGTNISWTLPAYGQAWGSRNGLPNGPWSATLGPMTANSQALFQYGDPQSGQTPEPSQCGQQGPYLLADENGEIHDLNLDVAWVIYESEYGCPTAPINTSGGTMDGSAISASITGFAYDQWSPGSSGGEGASGYLSGVRYPNGTTVVGDSYNYPSNYLEDSNGNIASYVYDNPPSPTGHWADSTGRSVASSPFGPGTQDLAAPHYTLGNYPVVTQSVSGTSQTYNLVVGQTTPSLNFTLPHPATGEIGVLCSTCTYATNSILPPTQSGVIVLSQLSLPNSTSYQFTYDPTYGTVSKITFPEGGYVRFLWGVRSIGRQQQGAVWATKVSTIVVTDVYTSDGGAPENHWHYDYANMDPTTFVLVTTETAPDGMNTQYTNAPFLVGMPNTGFTPTYVETMRQIRAGSGSLLKTVATAYTGSFPLPTQITTTIWDGPSPIQSQAQFTYDKYANVAEEDQSDFYACATATPCTNSPAWIKKTLTSFLWPKNPAYEVVHIVNKPSLITTTDGNGTPLSQVQYGYDEFALADGAGIVNHDDASYPATRQTGRGNLTSEARCITFSSGTCSQWNSATYYRYDVAGRVIQATDPRNNSIYFSYGDNYVVSTGTSISVYSPPAPTDSYVTQITYPNGAHDNYSYYYYSGDVASHSDWNGQITSYIYDNTLNRLIDTSYPDGGDVGISYNGDPVPPKTTTTTKLNTTSSLVRSDQFDGLHRLVRDQLVSDSEGSINTDRTYDGNGRLGSVSNPYRSQSDATNGFTSFAYDALDRPIVECEADNGNGSSPCSPQRSYKQWSYTGNIITYSDEASNSWLRITDALGRLTSVTEPNGAQTSYGYDALGNLLTVNQNGVTGTDIPRTRQFSYDSLSRLIQGYNPESGWTCYGTTPANAAPNGSNCTEGYDGNGNLRYKTDARGVIGSYSYDDLNRLAGKSYQNPDLTFAAPSDCFLYDSNSTSTPPNAVGRLTAEWTQAGACPSSAAALPTSGVLTAKIVNSYDPMGRLLVEQTCVLSNCAQSHYRSQSFSHDIAGNLTGYSDGFGLQSFGRTYDAAGRLNFVTSSWWDPTHPPVLYGVQNFGPFGVVNATNGADISVNKAYDTRGRVASMSVEKTQ